MELFKFIRLLILIMPLGIFFTLGLLVFVAIVMRHIQIEAIFKRILSFYCLAASSTGFLFLTYYYQPLLFSRLDILYAASVIFTMILFYHLLCIIIRVKKPFSIFHYIFAALTCMGMYVCKLLLPDLWQQEGTRALLIIAIIFGGIYSLYTLIRIHEHQLKLTLKHNTTETIDKIKAAAFIIEFLLFPWVFAICPLISGQDPGVFTSILLMGSILLALRMNIPLVYAIIRHYATPFNTVSLLAADLSQIVSTDSHSTHSPRTEITELQESEKPIAAKDPLLLESHVNGGFDSKTKDKGNKRIYRKYSPEYHYNGQLIEINKKTFEAYIRKHKPYLNPELTINDLAESLHSNRTYISKYINQMHGMNFRSYINLCRLNEIKHLLTLPENKNKTAIDLFQQAGFTSHRNYLRIQKIVDEDKWPKISTEND